MEIVSRDLCPIADEKLEGVSSPRFSIVIPVYNASRYLRGCLDSVLEQSFRNWEVICVDDGSQDLSGRILEEYSAVDMRIRVIRQANAGVSSARNRALKIARGEFVVFLDADDCWDKELLFEINRIIETESPDAIRFRFLRFCSDKAPLLVHGENTYVVINGQNAVKEFALNELVSGGWGCLIFWRRLKLSIGQGFPEGVKYAEDALFTLAQMSEVGKLVQSEFVGYFYRDTPGSAMKRAFSSRERLCFLKSFAEIQAVYGRPHPKLSWMAWFNLVNWIRRPQELDFAKEIHVQFLSLVQNGAISPRHLPHYSYVPFVIYCSLGWLWPARLVYHCVELAVGVRDRVKNRCLSGEVTRE